MQNGIAVIGAGMIGAAHSFGYRANVPKFSADLPGLRLKTVCDGNIDLAKDAARTFGYEHCATEWQAVIADPEVAIISVCLPNFLHALVTREALAAGKHVLCEKPLALDAHQALELYRASIGAKGVSGTVFNYRRIPAITEIHNLVGAGELGDLISLRVQYESDYAADAMLPHSWRYQRDKAGPGALLDLGTHCVDLARYLCGEIDEVVGALSSVSVKQRYLPSGAVVGHNRVELSRESRTVDNDDVMSALLRFESGCQGSFLASRVAIGMGNTLSFVLSGSKGTVRYTTQAPSHFEIALLKDLGRSQFAMVSNSPNLPYVGAVLPVAFDGVSIGYTEIFGFMIGEFLSAIATGTLFENGSILDGLRAAQVLSAIDEAAIAGAPTKVSRIL